MTGPSRPALRPRPVESTAGLGRQSALGAAVVALALAISAALIGVGIRDDGRVRTDLLSRVDPAVLAVQRLGEAVYAQSAAVREYAITGDPARRGDYDRAVSAETAATGAAARLLRRARGSGPARAGLDEVTTAVTAWRHDLAAPVLARTGRTDLGGALGRTGEQRFDAVRTALADERARLDTLHGRTVRRLRSEAAAVGRALAAGAVVLVIGAVALTMLVRITLLRPVTELTGRVRRVSEGDFDHPLDVTGPAEIAELAAHVDAMRDHILNEWRTATEAQIMLGEQAAELRRSNKELGRSNTELEQFAYVASHDLQEPLRNIARFCELLERRYSGVLDERGKRYIEYAVGGAARMQTLIDDLLAFSRVERSGREMTAVACDEVMDQALENLGLALSESDAGITRDPLPEVTGDPVLLTHLLQNLLSNAIKFRREAAPRVHVGVRRDGDLWEFACSDNGIGIDPAHADRIFLVFQRLHPKDDYSGTGIGLALCRKIVEYHGGRIWLDADHGGAGTVIRWTLPA